MGDREWPLPVFQERACSGAGRIAQGGGRPEKGTQQEGLKETVEDSPFVFSGIDLRVIYWLNVISGFQINVNGRQRRVNTEDNPLPWREAG